jgi:geranylgeranyl diphosphate synthase type I
MFMQRVDARIESMFAAGLLDEVQRLLDSGALGWLNKDIQPIEIPSGKRIRPALCLLTYEAISGSRDNAVPLAAATELFHAFTLAHDDIMDKDEERRGLPTLWKVWGDGIALTAGDSLFSLAFASLRDIKVVTNKTLLYIYENLADTGICLGTGQHLDLVFESNQQVNQEMYLEMVSGKTVALMKFATYSAAMLATEDKTKIEQMKIFGENLGYAFQIRDDYLNLWGEDYKSKKTAYGDLVRKKKTFPIIYAFANIDDHIRQEMTKIYSNNQIQMDKPEQEFMLDVLDNVDAQKNTMKIIDSFIAKAFSALETAMLRNNMAHERLILLTNYLLGRNQ